MATDEERAAMANVLVDTNIGGIHFHARFANEASRNDIEYFVNKRKVGEEVYDRMLATARAVTLGLIAHELSDDGTIAEQLSFISDALYGDDRSDGYSVTSKLNRLIDTIAEHE